MTAQPDLWRDLADTFAEVSAPRLALPEWADRYRIVTGETAFPGRWNAANAPMALEPMRAFTDPAVRVVVLVTPSQLMKTEFIINCALHTAHYGDTCLLYEPDKELAKAMIANRIRPSLKAMGAGEFAGADDAHTKKRDASMELHIDGFGAIIARTPVMKTGLSAYTARVVVIDEIDKMKLREMMVIARERTTVYGEDAKVAVVSTPTIDALGTAWREWSIGSCGVWHGRCRHCAELVSMDWGDAVKFDTDDSGFWLLDTLVMACTSCGSVWTETDRLAAAHAGAYVHERPDAEQRTFRVPGPAHLWRTLETIATLGAQARRATIEEDEWVPYIAWTNGMLARPWDDAHRGLSASKLEASTWAPGARGLDDLGPLPDGALVVTAGADTGADHIAVEWVAWGLDVETGRVRSWGLRYVLIGGGVDDSIDEPHLWEAFDREIRRSVWRRGDRLVQAARILVDEGYRPERVRAWCHARYAANLPARRRTFEAWGAQVGPVRGMRTGEDAHGYPINRLIAQRPPPKRAPRPLPPLTLCAYVGKLKDQMYDWGQRDDLLPRGEQRAHTFPERGAAHGYTELYFREFASEVRRPHYTQRGRVEQRWEKRHGWTRNEPLDVRVYALAALYQCAYPVGIDRYLAAVARQVAPPPDAGNVVPIR